MNFKSLVRTTLFVLGTAMSASIAFAQTYPDRPVRIIVPLSPGTGADTVARALAEKLQAKWGQQVVVDNRPGAGGITAINALKQTPADGYTLLIGESGMISIAPHVFKKVPFETATDFAGTTSLFRTYYVLTTSGSGPFDSYQKMIATAQKSPNAISFASTGVGSPAHLGGAVLSTATQAVMLHAPYKDASQMFSDVSTGTVSWVWATPGSLRAFLDSKRLRAIAAAAPKRLRGFEDVPTIAELGGPADFTVDNWVALLARRGTPVEIINKISRDAAEAIRGADLQKRLQDLGYEVFTSSPGELDELMARDTHRYGTIVKRVNIEPQ